MSKSKRTQANNTTKWVGIGLVVVFIGSILVSMVFETLLPLWRSGDTAGFVNNMIGLPIVLLATGTIVYGGYRVVSATFTTFQSDDVQQNIRAFKGSRDGSTAVRARLDNARRLFVAWAPGGAVMLFGFGLMALGGWLINR